MKADVTVVIPTKDRYDTTLPLSIMSVINQTTTPKRLIIIDDGEKKDLREDALYQYIFKSLDRKGIQWEVAFGAGKGQVHSHQKSIEMTKTEWIYRVDDDCVLEPACLEELLTCVDDTTGAVGGCILDPKQMPTCSFASSKIEDIYLGMNEQWFPGKDVKEVDHLYSTFIYRKRVAVQVGGYCMDLSPAGHREETIFTHTIKRAGWKLKINPKAVTLHFRYPDGGIRTNKDVSMWAYDDAIFSEKMKQWGVEPRHHKVIVLNCGLGDHLVFKCVLPEIKKKYPDLILGVCYREVFEDDGDVKLVSVAEANMMTNPDEHSVYKFLWDHESEQMDLETAYRRMYL